MNTDVTNIAIIGAGAVGGYYGARLAQHGADVHFLLRSDFDHVRRNGFTITSVDGDFTLPPDRFRAYDDPAKMPRADLVLVTVKTTANADVPALVAPLLHDRSTVITLQNGLGNEDYLARHFGASRVLGGMAFVCINRLAPGVLAHTERGVIRVGELSPGVTDRVHRIVELFKRSNINAEPLENLRAGRWEKLVWNVPFNGLGALLDATTDELLGSEHGVAMVRGLMDEVVAAAKGNGIDLPTGVADRMIDATRPMIGYRSSTHVDRLLGRPMEVEAVFGEPLRAARAGAISTPMLEMLYRTLSLLNHPKAAPSVPAQTE